MLYLVWETGNVRGRARMFPVTSSSCPGTILSTALEQVRFSRQRNTTHLGVRVLGSSFASSAFSSIFNSSGSMSRRITCHMWFSCEEVLGHSCYQVDNFCTSRSNGMALSGDAPKKWDLQGQQDHLVRHAARRESMISCSYPSVSCWMLGSKMGLALTGWTDSDEIRVSDWYKLWLNFPK